MQWNSRRALAATGAAFGLAAVLKGTAVAGLCLQFLLGKLAYSTSDGAALYLLGFSVLAAWALCWHPKPGKEATGLVILGLSLAAGHGLNLWLSLRYGAEMQIPLGAHVYHWQGDSYSFTSLFHSHLGKTAFSLVAQAWGKTVAGYDGGAVFLPWVVSWASWGIALAFMGGCIGGLMALPEFAKTRHGAHVILYVLTASLALRAMLDGGPLAPGTPPLFLALSWLCLFKHPNDQPSAWSRPVIGLMMSFGVLGMYCWFWIDASDGIPPVGILLLPVLWTFWLALIGSGPASGWRMLGRLGALGLFTVMVTVDASESLLPMLKPLSKGCVAVSFATDPPSEIDCAEKTAQEVYRALGEDDRKPRFTLIAANPVRGESALPLGLLIIDAADGRFTTTASSAWPSLVIAPRSGPGGWHSVLAHASPRWPAVLTYGSPDVLSRNNYNVYLWELGRNLQKGGLTEFVLMPQTAGNLVHTP